MSLCNTVFFAEKWLIFCRLKLYVKLFIMMGITWSMEIISWLFEDVPSYTWYFSDLANSLQGLIIFITFVWRDKIKTRLLKRFNCEKYTCLLFSRKRKNCDNMDLRTYTSSRQEWYLFKNKLEFTEKYVKHRRTVTRKNSSNESAYP